MNRALAVVRSDTPSRPPADQPRAFPLTDIGNAERFVAFAGADVHYVAPWRRWYVWDSRRWRSDDTLEVHRLAKECLRDILDHLSDIDDDAERKRVFKHAQNSESDSRVRAMLERVKAEPGIAILPSELDRDPWLLSVENGVIDLRTGELLEHDRSRLITKTLPVRYDETATAPTWDAFLKRSMNGDEDLVAFLQRAIGYSLTGQTDEQCLFFLYGAGANGKSTFLEIVRVLLAEYAQQADFTTFLERKGDGPRNDIARLFGARVVTSSEVGEGKRLNESLVKTLTGTDTVTARFLHAEFFEFRPAFKLWLAANHRPVIRGTDSAIWRRVRLIPFTVQIPEAERDPRLVEKLRAELPGILTWAVNGCMDWQRDGLGVPAAVREATDAYRRDSDTLGVFLEECTAIGEGFAVRAGDLYSAYRAWAREAGEWEMSQTAFGRKLEERGHPAEKRGRDRDRTKWRLGLKLLDGVRLFGEQVGTKPVQDHREAAANDRESELPFTAEEEVLF